MHGTCYIKETTTKEARTNELMNKYENMQESNLDMMQKRRPQLQDTAKMGIL